MMTKTELLEKLADGLPLRIISDGGRPYLERYYIGAAFGWRFYLHRFVGPDPAGGLHDHPWRLAFSLRLAGRYYEQTRYGTRAQRWLGILTGDTFHRVAALSTPTVWTLFGHTVGGEKSWGFLKAINGRFSGGMYTDGSALFEPYTYQREGNQAKWWTTAKSKKQLRAGQ